MRLDPLPTNQRLSPPVPQSAAYCPPSVLQDRLKSGKTLSPQPNNEQIVFEVVRSHSKTSAYPFP